jgi:hypothetical protein
MKYSKVVFVFFVVSMYSFGQENNLYIDLDHDKKLDSIFYNNENAVITCKLSSQKFKVISSLPQEHIGNDLHGINETKSGFEFYNDDMRSGHKCQFQYDTTTKRIKLIGIYVYNYGGASHDGAGNSSINLLTRECEGQWEYYKDIFKLVKTPHLKCKMYLPETFLEDFGEDQPDEYATKASAFYEKERDKLLHSKKKKK